MWCVVGIIVVSMLLNTIETRDKIIKGANIERVVEYRMPDRPPFTIDPPKPTAENPKQN